MPPGKNPFLSSPLSSPIALLPASIQLPRNSHLALALRFSTGANLRAQALTDSPDSGQEQVSNSSSGHLSGQPFRNSPSSGWLGLAEENQLCEAQSLPFCNLDSRRKNRRQKVLAAEGEKAFPVGRIRADVKGVTCGS